MDILWKQKRKRSGKIWGLKMQNCLLVRRLGFGVATYPGLNFNSAMCCWLYEFRLHKSIRKNYRQRLILTRLHRCNQIAKWFLENIGASKKVSLIYGRLRYLHHLKIETQYLKNLVTYIWTFSFISFDIITFKYWF